MYEVSVTTHFSAAHRLIGYPGSCAKFHGHNWEVELFLRGPTLNEIGILIDFREVKITVREVLGELDHGDLNQVPAFVAMNPTSENVARYLFEAFSRRLQSERFRVVRVRVAETPGTSAWYWDETNR